MCPGNVNNVTDFIANVALFSITLERTIGTIEKSVSDKVPISYRNETRFFERKSVRKQNVKKRIIVNGFAQNAKKKSISWLEIGN